MTVLRAVDLFCGAGGFAHGMQKAGIKIVRSMDHDPAVIEVHKTNIKHVEHRLPFRPAPSKQPPVEDSGKFRRGQVHTSRKTQHVVDLTAIVDIAPEVTHDKPDIIFGGPPCQAFSSAGKGEGDDDPRSTLTEAFAIIVAAARPKYFVMENVKGLRKSLTYKRAVAIFRRVGYGLSEAVVNASSFGTPQARERLILAGCLDETDGWFHAYLNQYKSAQRINVTDVLGSEFGTLFDDFTLDAECPDAVTEAASDEYKGYRLREADLKKLAGKNPETRFYYCAPGGPASGAIHRTDRPAPTLIRTSTDGLSHRYRPQAGDPVDLRKVAQPSFDQFSRLAGYPAGWNWGALRSQTSDSRNPDDMILGARQRQLMLANSVPPPLAFAIGRSIVDHHNRKVPSVPIEAAAVQQRTWKVSTREVARYKDWLRIAKRLAGRRLIQEITDLRAAKGLTADRGLAAAAEELKALEGMPATAEPHMSRGRKSQLCRTLANLAEFQYYQSYVQAGLFPDDDKSYARGDLRRMLEDDDPIDDSFDNFGKLSPPLIGSKPPLAAE
nr:DNA cytosine methyltransferase [Mesorhizobium camelthorni]